MVFDVLVPRPKRIRPKKGRFAIPERVFIEHSKALRRQSRAVAVVAEALAAAGGETRIRCSATGRPGFWLRIGPEEAPKPSARCDAKGKLLGEQGHRINVLPSQVRLAAASEQGLYYAACTFEQMVRAARGRALPAAQIEDWPDMGLRMILYDIARDRDYHPEYVKRMIDEASRFKINALILYLEYRYAFPSHPGIAPAGSLTPAHARDLDRFARERFVEVIPQVNCLGHMEGINNLERYQDLAEDISGLGFQACPSNRDVIPLLRDIYRDVSAPFSTGLLHVGGDESWELGVCPRCQQRAKRLGKGGLYRDHVNKVRRIAHALGKRMAIWGDMLLTHPDALDRLPRDVLVFDWRYVGTRPKSMRLLRRKGFEIVVCPASSTFFSNAVAHGRSVDNIRRMIADGHRSGAIGECTCLWELSKGSYPEYGWPHVVLSAECAWNRKPMAQRALARAFTRQFFGYDGEEIEHYLRLAGDTMPEALQFLDPQRGRRLRDLLFASEDPLKLWIEIYPHWSPGVANKVRATLREARRVLAVIERKATRNREVLPYLAFPMRLYQFLLDYTRIVAEARKAYRAAAGAQRRHRARFVHALSQCADSLGALDSQYEELEEFLRRAHRETGAPRLDVERVGLMRRLLDDKARQLRTLAFEGPTLLRFELVARRDWRLYNQANWR